MRVAFLPKYNNSRCHPCDGITPVLEASTNDFALHSKPGASKVFILDFDGHTISGTAWNSSESSYSATPFDTDGNFNNVIQWSKGEYSRATSSQDDLGTLFNQLAYRRDDHSSNSSSATKLVIDADGSVNVSNPQTDPANTIFSNKGIIETHTDIDTCSSGSDVIYTAGKKRGNGTASYTVSDGEKESTATISIAIGGSTGGDSGGKCHPKRGC